MLIEACPGSFTGCLTFFYFQLESDRNSKSKNDIYEKSGTLVFGSKFKDIKREEQYEGTFLWHCGAQWKHSSEARGPVWWLLVGILKTNGLGTSTWPTHPSLLKHSKLCLRRTKLLFPHKRSDQRFSHRIECRTKSDYFQWNPPFSTCQLTMSMPLCPLW